MKKVYLQPSVEIVDIELNTTMMSASNGDNVPVDPNEKDEFDTNGRRGGWGTLWD